MKQYKRFVLMVSVMALCILACQVGGIALGDGRTVRGSGNVVEETRAVSGVTGVELRRWEPCTSRWAIPSRSVSRPRTI